MVNKKINLELSPSSKLLITYYDELKKISKKEFVFSQRTGGAAFLNFQNYIFLKLESIYSSLKKDLCPNLELNLNLNLEKYRTIHDSFTKEYHSLVTNVYNKHFNNNRYITPEIKNYIKSGQKTNKNKLLTYTLPYKMSSITINFFVYDKDIKLDIEKYDNKAFHMMAIIQLMTILSDNSNVQEKYRQDICSKDGIQIYIFLTPFKREIEPRDIVLGAKNVNGGFCYGCISAGEIIVYRREEWFKVFVHELAHNFGVDAYIWKFKRETGFNEENYQNFINNFNLSSAINRHQFDIGLQECIVEFWGEFLNNAVFSLDYAKNHSCSLKNSKKSFQIYCRTFEKIANLEILHGFIQTTKILHQNGLTYADIINNNAHSLNNYTETTHLFSYYILRTLMIYGYKNILDFNYFLQDSKIVFNPDGSKDGLKSFFNFITDSSRNETLKQNFEFIEELYDFLREHRECKELDFIVKNLRMSILEI